MKILAAVAVLFFALVGAASAQNVYLLNTSTVVSPGELNRMLPALQAQVSQDFAPVWDIDAHLAVTDTPPAGAWVIEISDDATINGALGYHDVCHTDGHGTPCGYVFAKTAEDAGYSASVTLSHELLEMLADPFTTTTVKVGSRFYLQEVCDAPESEAYAYTRGGVLLSDFVTPFFYRPGHVGPYDFRGVIPGPLQLMSGGYISFWQNGSWHQNFKRGLRGIA